MSKFEGTYELLRSDNFDEYMKKIRVAMPLRAVAQTLKPEIRITVDGDKYCIKTVSAFKTSVIEFKEGVEFDEKTIDDRMMKTVISIDGNKMIQVQKATTDGDLDSVITREFSDDGFKLTLVAEDVKAERVYKRK